MVGQRLHMYNMHKAKCNIVKFLNYYFLGMFDLKPLNHYPMIVCLYNHYIFLVFMMWYNIIERIFGIFMMIKVIRW